MLYWCRPLLRNTNFHLPCLVMRVTRLEKSGVSHQIYLVHYLEGKLMFLTKMEFVDLSTTISSNPKSILMRPWSFLKVFETDPYLTFHIWLFSFFYGIYVDTFHGEYDIVLLQLLAENWTSISNFMKREWCLLL